MPRTFLAGLAVGLLAGAVGAAVGLRLAAPHRSDGPGAAPVEAAPPHGQARSPAPAAPIASATVADPAPASAPPLPQAPASPAAGGSGASLATAPDEGASSHSRPPGAVREDLRAALGARDGRRIVSLLGELIDAGPEARGEAIAAIADVAANRGKYGLHHGTLIDLLEGESSFPLLKDALDRPDLDPAARRIFLETIGESQSPEAVAYLSEKAGSGTGEVSREYLTALARRPEPAARDALVALASATERPSAARLGAVHALAGRDDPEVRAALAGLLQSPAASADLRLAALDALGGFADPSLDAVLANAARLDADAQVRERAALALVRRNPPVAGILVERVTPNTQAEVLGLRPGDIIVEYNGTHYADMGALAEAVRGTPSDRQVPLRVRRGEQTLDLSVRGRFIGIYGDRVVPR